MVTIIEKEDFSIIIDKESSIFNIDFRGNEKFNMESYNEFIEYFRNTWQYIYDNNLKYFILIKVSDEKKNNIPLDAIVKLIQVLNDMNHIRKKCLHSIVVVTKDAETWRGLYDFIEKFRPPDDRNAILFTNNINDSNEFFSKNKNFN